MGTELTGELAAEFAPALVLRNFLTHHVYLVRQSKSFNKGHKLDVRFFAFFYQSVHLSLLVLYVEPLFLRG